MPVEILGTRTQNYTGIQVSQFLLQEYNINLTFGDTVSRYGVTKIVEHLVDGMAQKIFSIVGVTFTLQQILNMMEEVRFKNKLLTVVNKMADLERQNKPTGRARITFERRRWVSSNGNQYSGVYEVPIDATWISN